MENLQIYEAVRSVPENAKKTIKGGKLNGFTDINPMWRIKTLTERFGPCGIGWYSEITRQWTEENSGIVCAFCNINLYIKIGDEWSKPIPGTGGSRLATKNKNGIEVSDECYKMAYTDAIGVAAKALGIGADVYWSADHTKYDYKEPGQSVKQKPKNELEEYITATKRLVFKLCGKDKQAAEGYWEENIAADAGDLDKIKFHYEVVSKKLMQMGR